LKTNSSIVLLAAALLLPAAVAYADPVTVNFTAQVKTSSGNLPATGSTLTGAYVFDSDPAAYQQFSNPSEPGYMGYQTLVPPYGLTLQWAGAPLEFTGLGLEVFDNGTTRLPIPAPSDTVSFNTKHNNVSYNMTLFGPDTSFTGNSLPTTQWLNTLWTTGLFSIRDNNIFQVVLTADILSVSVSAVPELPVASLLLAGLGALGLMQLATARRRRPAAMPLAA
jgi:type 1 fimbria pilin